MIQIILLILMSIFSIPTHSIGNCYDTYNENGLHLFINDNNTPTNYEDDWVYDWEDNRETIIFNLD